MFWAIICYHASFQGFGTRYIIYAVFIHNITEAEGLTSVANIETVIITGDVRYMLSELQQLNLIRLTLNYISSILTFCPKCLPPLSRVLLKASVEPFPYV